MKGEVGNATSQSRPRLGGGPNEVTLCGRSSDLRVWRRFQGLTVERLGVEKRRVNEEP